MSLPHCHSEVQTVNNKLQHAFFGESALALVRLGVAVL